MCFFGLSVTAVSRVTLPHRLQGDMLWQQLEPVTLCTQLWQENHRTSSICCCDCICSLERRVFATAVGQQEVLWDELEFDVSPKPYRLHVCREQFHRKSLGRSSMISVALWRRDCHCNLTSNVFATAIGQQKVLWCELEHDALAQVILQSTEYNAITRI